VEESVRKEKKGKEGKEERMREEDKRIVGRMYRVKKY